MAFKKKTWVDRMVEYAGRRKITNVTTMAAQIVDVERAEGVVSEEGTAINAVNMNDFEQRTADAFSAVQQDIEGINSDLGGLSFFEDPTGKYVVGADSVPKKLGSSTIKGHLMAGRTRGGAGIGEITYNSIPSGSSIKISNLSLPYGTNNAITFYVKVNGVSVLTTNGNYTIITDNSTLIIYMYIYLSEENKGGYGNCDYELTL